jgi:endoglycosylceramidase
VLRRLSPLLIAVALALSACSSTDSTDGATSEPAATSSAVEVAQVTELRPLTTAEGAIVDDQGRQVLLRGANVTSLGEYWQGDPDHPPTVPTTDADWDEMAANGFNVVRLVISWSRVEPTRGAIDESYLDEIDASVTSARQRGIYTVIDMHQDAYSAFIATGSPDECPEGSLPGKGWDGAPAWAVITDDASTCITGDRNSAPAVVNAWNHFWDDTDGIRARFTASWAAIAQRFAGRPEVAGYNLLNEPEVSRPAAELTPLYDDLLADTITAIRAAEANAPFEQLLFIEPAIPAGEPSNGLVVPDPARVGLDARSVVAAPHNYAESISGGLGLTIEATDDLFVQIASGLGVPVWVGEQGWWDVSDESLAEVRRAAASQDRLVLGGAWWQWRQPCGDPHSIDVGGWDDGPDGSGDTIVHLHQLGCPGDVDLGPTTEFLEVLSRGYPRASPGRVRELTSDPGSGSMVVSGDGGEDGAELVVWTPTSDASHLVEVSGLAPPIVHEVAGGRIIVAAVDGSGPYRLEVQPRAGDPSS